MNAAHPEVAVAPGQNPGELLRLAREKRGWSQAEVARKLNLTVSSLNHVETGAFDKLPGHTFARGYIRAYAKLMELDQAALVEAFDRYTGTHAKGSDVHSLGRIEEPSRLSHNILRGVSLLLLLAVVGGGFVWWQDQGSMRGKDLSSVALEHVEVESADGTTQIHPLDEPEDQAVSAAQQPESAPLPLAQSTDEQQAASTSQAPAADTPAAGSAPVTGTATPQPAPVPATATPVVSAPTAATPATSADAAEPAAAPAGSGKVAIEFVADCWTQVSDGNGKVLFSGIKRKGDNLELTGKAPFALRLGFARGAKVSYNGQSVDVAPFTSGETARLKLGQ
ncbi:MULTISPECIES: RodZ family helix-turn-helix domain-containing protein [Pseudomonas]|uniref:Cro/Cl family transcriptional regulator n=1 Tax=Pseudomonas parafulva TaxID=157782 RepID=A0ABM6J5R0_9PSED|nr:MULTISPECIES: RodZ family helix-turn-helix domain-containing protein [Pseudomonas]AQW69840.1 Cro/Cl family transcriptional regulator [Pseudomonas parafulva]MBF8679074.1 helix-turn-helix domain-containing protein [Pseudomonas fulva]MBF8717708.1 helix-turn-helix domain-containing protein [Pseudomonas fulva]MBF8764384.1 helix-turn-helix domain-containing protein [Pseudomonas putida]MBF8783149.1 helix-turn-helix domain-containing protein [Pseudomonas fulva]